MTARNIPNITNASTMIISRGTEMKFTKTEICDMTIAQANQIASANDNNPDWDFWAEAEQSGTSDRRLDAAGSEGDNPLARHER